MSKETLIACIALAMAGMAWRAALSATVVPLPASYQHLVLK